MTRWSLFLQTLSLLHHFLGLYWMREAAIRGFWVSTYAPFGYRNVSVQDGAKKRPKLELDSPADAVVRRIFLMALQGKST